MNILITVSLGFLLIIPTFSNSISKRALKTTAQVILGTTSAIGTTVILYNITKTAQRRLANPNYSESKSFGAILAQAGSILLHNKLLATFIAAGFAITGMTIYFASQDLKTDAKELKN